MVQSTRSRWSSKKIITSTLLVHLRFLCAGCSLGWVLIRGWALINFSFLEEGRLFEAGANLRLGASIKLINKVYKIEKSSSQLYLVRPKLQDFGSNLPSVKQLKYLVSHLSGKDCLSLVFPELLAYSIGWQCECKSLCKRAQHCWPTTPSIVGCNISRP